MRVAIVGGTGAEGFGLALRLGVAGHDVVIGSRDADRGAASAEKAAHTVSPDALISGTVNADSVVGAEVVAVTVPFGGMIDIYKAIAPALVPGQVVLDATSPLMTAVGGKAWQPIRPWDGSAAELAASLVPDGVQLVAGLHTVAAHELQALDEPIDSDVLLCGDDREAKRLVGSLVEDIPGMRWVDCGPLSNARITEMLTPLLISINRKYKVKDSGFRIVGRDNWGAAG